MLLKESKKFQGLDQPSIADHHPLSVIKQVYKINLLVASGLAHVQPHM